MEIFVEGITCHVHINVPSASSLNAAKSLEPASVSPHRPYVDPATTTELSLAIATALAESLSSVPSWDKRAATPGWGETGVGFSIGGFATVGDAVFEL